MLLIKMERYTLQRRIEIVEIHYKNGENFAETVRKVKSFLGYCEAPFRPAIERNWCKHSSFRDNLVM